MKCESRSKSHLRSILGFGAVGAGAYLFLLGRWQRSWSATRGEIDRKMPLDDEVDKPTGVTNRAITIRALPEHIWPWIAQMGELPRGGFYSHLVVERLLKMRVENAEEILPEFQNPRVGEALDRAGTMLVKAVEPGKILVLGPRPSPRLAVTWALALYPAGDGTTRLISRCRARFPRGIAGMLARLILDPGQLIMERKMLIEIKRRAESYAAKSLFEAPSKRRAG